MKTELVLYSTGSQQQLLHIIAYNNILVQEYLNKFLELIEVRRYTSGSWYLRDAVETLEKYTQDFICTFSLCHPKDDTLLHKLSQELLKQLPFLEVYLKRSEYLSSSQFVRREILKAVGIPITNHF
ncbi:hypothetical protein [Spartinivicinus poritis]|uniref:Uncharacterized protein n=1 Tax=Spartinivicinus poritis TaxID=2994640 RepID=A0ABT5UG52_9GAMM|nr:hypothetical protein [Spartinivicinus sp. A2-2]MDE1465369.1 hypothetical protein [Spartinivicinus sp. A2-2]